MADVREMFGDEYRLTILEKDGDAPPTTEKMFRLLLDELGVRGNFNFHAKGHLPQSAPDAKPRMSAVLAGNQILVSMRWGTREKDSVSGSLYVPSGSRPAEVQKRMVNLLGTLNAEGWPELEVNGSEHARVEPGPLPQQITVTVQPTSPPPTASNVAQSDENENGDEALALALLKKAGANAVIPNHCIRDYLHKQHPKSPNRTLVSDTIARLEEGNVLRRVRIEDSGEWQFTETFLTAQGKMTKDYNPLPAVVVKIGGNRGPTVSKRWVPIKDAAPASPTPVVAGTPSAEEEPLVLTRLKERYARSDVLSLELEKATQRVLFAKQAHAEAAAKLEAEQQEAAEIGAKLQALKAEIDAARAEINPDELLKLLLHRSAL